MLRQLHALVVDDEPHCRDLLCRQIGRTCPSITVMLDTGAVVPMAVRKREALKQRLSLLMSA